MTNNLFKKFLKKILDVFKSCVIKKNDCEKMCPTCDSPKPTERPTTKPRPQTCEEIFAIDIKKCNTSCESKFQYCWKSCKTLPCRVQCYSQNKKCLEGCPCRNLRYNKTVFELKKNPWKQKKSKILSFCEWNSTETNDDRTADYNPTDLRAEICKPNKKMQTLLRESISKLLEELWWVQMQICMRWCMY